MPPKRQKTSSEASNSTPRAAASLKKRLNEDENVPSSSAKRRKPAPPSLNDVTPLSQRMTRARARVAGGSGSHRTLEDEFKEIAADASEEAKIELSSGSRESSLEDKAEDQVAKNATPKNLELALKSPSSEDNQMSLDAQIRKEMGLETPLKTPSKNPSKRGKKKRVSNVKEELEEEVDEGVKGDDEGDDKSEVKDNDVSMEDAGEQEAPSAEKSKNTRIRFDSNEPSEQPAPATTTEMETEKPETGDEEEEEDEDESDDEAPEETTQATAIAQAKAAAADAAKAAARQKAEEKRRRQERDARLKEQARQSQKKKPEVKESSEEASSPEPHESAPAVQAPSGVPDLLPESLLARAGDVRAPSPDQALVEHVDPQVQKRNQHIKFIEQGERPVKDVQKGPVNVRVMEKQNTFMAPKSQKNSNRMLREFMLQGRYGDGSAKPYPKMERKKTGGGFLKR